MMGRVVPSRRRIDPEPFRRRKEGGELRRPVAVRVGLDHRAGDDAGSGPCTELAQVMLGRRAIELYPDEAAH